MTTDPRTTDRIEHYMAALLAADPYALVERRDDRTRLAEAAMAVADAEQQRLHTERTRYRTAWRLARTRALSTSGAADRYATRAREGQTALADMVGALIGMQMERDEAQAEAAALRAVLAKTAD